MIDKEVIARATIYSVTLLQISTRSLQVCCSNLSARAFYVACLVYLKTDTFQQSKHSETQNPEPDSSFVICFSHGVIRTKLSIHMISLPWLSVCAPFEVIFAFL